MTETDSGFLEFQAKEADAESRLDHFLTRHCPDYSRSRIQKTIKAGRVRIDGEVQPARYRLKPGEVIRFKPPAPAPGEALPEELPLDIIYQDASIAIVNKAAGMVTHPAPGHYTGTLVNALHYRFNALPGGDRMRAGIVHRLDMDTSGLLVIALDEQAHASLSAQIQERRLGRIYSALSWGQWKEDTATITTQIARHPTRRRLMAVVETGGKTAITHYSMLEDYGFAQYCRVELGTGRTHQIRVHFAHYGHQILGDRIYGDDLRIRNLHPLDVPKAKATLKDVDRQLLHASELHLEHPCDGRPLVFKAPLPPDFVGALRTLRGEEADQIP